MKFWPAVVDQGDGADGVEFSSEASIASYMLRVFEDLIRILGLPLKMLQELSVFEVRPDEWIVTWSGAPVGAVEYKRPGQRAMTDKRILGEVFDAASQLLHFYGMPMAMSLLISGEEFRVCWFAASTTNSKWAKEFMAREEPYVAAGSQPSTPVRAPTTKGAGCDDAAAPKPKKLSPPIASPSRKVRRQPHALTVVEETDTSLGVWVARSVFKSRASDTADPDGGDERRMFVSDVYRWDAPNNAALRMLMSALVKMNELSSQRIPLKDPFERLWERRLIQFVRGDKSFFWSGDLKLMTADDVDWDSVVRMKRSDKYVYAVEDLGRGADGRVWLAVALRTKTTRSLFAAKTTSTLCPLVLKFGNKNSLERITKEYDNWVAAYPEFKDVVANEIWSGRHAVRMPHFTEVQENDRKKFIRDGQVRKTLQENFHNKGLRHYDVKWRNIGTYMSKKGECRIVVFDLSSVKKYTGDDSWVDEAIASLRETAGGFRRQSIV